LTGVKIRKKLHVFNELDWEEVYSVIVLPRSGTVEVQLKKTH